MRAAQDRAGDERGCTDTTWERWTLVWPVSESGPLCAVLRSVVSLQSPFQHTAGLEAATLRVYDDVEGRRTKLKDQANMHKVFRLCFAKRRQGQLFFFFFLKTSSRRNCNCVSFFFCSTLLLLQRGNNNGLRATSFLHLYCNCLW